ncbi:MAG: hypothetical protein LBS84_04310 [Clostridiales bacterium]|nr:hypothetical protein [Clostridiales bacterium]
MLKKHKALCAAALMAISAAFLRAPTADAATADLGQSDFIAQEDSLYRVESEVSVINLTEDVEGSIEIAAGVDTLTINGNGYSLTQLSTGWNTAIWTEDSADDLTLTIVDLTIKNSSDMGVYLTRGGSLTVNGDFVIEPAGSYAAAEGIVINTEKPFDINGGAASSLKVNSGTLVDDFEDGGTVYSLSIGHYAIYSASQSLTFSGGLSVDLTGGYGDDYAGSAVYASGGLAVTAGHVVSKSGESPGFGAAGAIAGVVYINGGAADFIGSQSSGVPADSGVMTNGLFLTGPGEINATGGALDISTEFLYIASGAAISAQKQVNILSQDVYPLDLTVSPAGLYTVTVDDFDGYQGETDINGKLQVWLPVGSYQLIIQDSDGATMGTEIVLGESNAPITVDFLPDEDNPPEPPIVTPPPVDTRITAPLFRTKPAEPPTEEYLASLNRVESPINKRAATLENAEDLASELYKLNLFVGTGNDINGNPRFELDRSLTRLESLTLVIRLLGKEAAANSYTGVNPFRDVPAWGDRIAAYAFNQGITVGVNRDHTLLDSNSPVTYQEFTAFLLRVLDYQERNGDFQYAQALNKAVEVGLYTAAERQNLSAGSFLRADAVTAMTNALMTKMKGTNSMLIDKLVSDNVIEAKARDEFLAAVVKY